MSKTIDEKVVQMEFDNQRFNENVKSSLTWIDKLKGSLDFSDASKGIGNVEKAVGKVNLNPVAEAVDTVSVKFSALQIAAITALQNITNKAVDAGEQLVKSLSLDQVTAGWQKYEDKTSSVQTIVNATGKSMDEVNDVLDKLVWYTDETSYNFVDMVGNIGKFTSAGVELEDAVFSMQGIANAAALAGANSEQASRAMYNFAQALGMGYVGLKDWMSIENANMATKEFKQILIDTAHELGTLDDTANVTFKNFRETIGNGDYKGWLTTEVLTTALSQYGSFASALAKASDETDLTATELLGAIDDYMAGSLDMDSIMKETGMKAEELDEIFKELASDEYALGRRSFKAAQEAKTFTEAINATKDAVSTKWMQIFEAIFGDYEEAKELWTDLANELWDVFAGALDAKVELLNEWKGLEIGGRDDLIQAFWNVFHSIQDLAAPVKEAFRDIFPEMTVERLAEIIKKVKDFTEKLFISDETADKLQRTFRGLFSVLDIAKQLFSALLKPLLDLIKNSKPLLDRLLDISAAIGDWFTNLDKTIKENDIFNTFIQNIIDKLTELKDKFLNSKVGKAITWVVDAIKDAFKDLFNVLRDHEKIEQFTKNISDRFAELKEKIDNSKLVTVLKKIKDAISDFFKEVKDKFKSFGSVDTSGAKKLADDTEKAFHPITSLFSGLAKILQSLVDISKTLFPVISKVLGAIAQTVVRFVKELFGSVKKLDLETVVDFLKSGTIATIATSLSTMFINVGRAGKTFVDIAWDLEKAVSAWKKQQYAETLKTMAVAIGILTLSMIGLSTLDVDQLYVATAAMSAMFAELVAAYKQLNFNPTTGYDKDGGIIGVFKSTRSSSTSLLSLAAAILILSVALKKLGDLDWEGIGKGVIGLGSLFEMIIVFEKQLSGNKVTLVENTGTLISLSVALLVLTQSMKEIAKLDWNGVAKGLVGVGGLLLEIVAFEKLMGMGEKGSKSTTGALSLIAVGAALILIVKAVKELAALDWDSLGVGVAGIGALLSELGIFMQMVGKTSRFSKNTYVTLGLALIEIGAAMLLFANAIKQLSELSWEQLAKGLVGFGAALIVTAAAMKMMPTDVSIIASGLAMIELGAAMFIIVEVLERFGKLSMQTIVTGLVAMGVALLEMGAALNLMSNTSILSATSVLLVVAALAIMVPVLKVLGEMPLSTIATGLLAIAGVFAVFIAAGILLTPVIAVLAAFAAVMSVFSTSLVVMGAGLLVISLGVTSLFTTLSVVVEEIIEVVIKLITAIPDAFKALAKSLALCIPPLIELIVNFITGILTVIDESLPRIIKTILGAVVQILAAIVEYIPQIIRQLLEIVVSVLDGLAEGLPKVVSSVFTLFKKLFEAIRESLGDIDIGSLALAIVACTELSVLMALIAVVAAEALVATITLPIIGTNLSKFVENLQGFLDGIQNVDASTFEAVKYLAEAILLLTSAGIIDAVSSFLTGKSPLVAIGSELASFAPYLKSYSDSITGIDAELVAKSGIAAMALAMFANSLPKEGGLLSKITGSNSIVLFGQELEKFGPSLKTYSNSLVGINPETITASSYAAKTISDFANSIPKKGGLVGLITGSNSIVDFGKELEKFGPSFAAYSKHMEDVRPWAVKASSSAAESIAAFANNIPDSGGVLSWLFTGNKSLSKFGEDLAAFGPNFKTYSNSIVGISQQSVENSAAAAGSLAEMVNKLPETGGIEHWFTGSKNLVEFGETLKEFGPLFKSYAISVSGISTADVLSSANAATALAKFADNLPVTGGLGGWFNGDKDIKAFGEKLKDLGTGIKDFAVSVSGIETADVISAANAATALTKFVTNLPETNGAAQWFSGYKDISGFISELKPLGTGLKEFAIEVDGISNTSVISCATAAKALSSIFSNLPETNGAAQLFSGYKDISGFADNLEPLGRGVRNFAIQTTGINALKVRDAAAATKELIGVFNDIPETGGFFRWFTGDKDLGGFADGIAKLAPALGAFNDSAGNISEVKLDSIKKGAEGLSALIIALNGIPETGGYMQWITGTIDIGGFSEKLPTLGENLKTFSNKVRYVKQDKVKVAAECLADIALAFNAIPETGGYLSWFTGEKDLSFFDEEFVNFGKNLQSFSKEIADISPENVTAASNAGLLLAEMLDALPEYGGVADKLFGAKMTLPEFAQQLVDFGPKFAEYAASVADITTEDVDGSTNSALALTELVKNLPDSAALGGLFGGEKDLADFGTKLVSFGDSFKSYSEAMTGVEPEVIDASTAAALCLVDLQKSLLSDDLKGWNESGNGKSIEYFGSKMKIFGEKFKGFYAEIEDIKVEQVTWVINALNKMVDLIKSMDGINLDNLGTFGEKLGYMGSQGLTDFINSFDNSEETIKTAAGRMLSNFISGLAEKKPLVLNEYVVIFNEVFAKLDSYNQTFNAKGQALGEAAVTGISSKKDDFVKAVTDMINEALNKMKDKKHIDEWYDVGVNVVQGMADGINNNTYIIKNAATTIAQAALKAAREELKEKSPSKAFYEIGEYSAIGFVNALDDYDGVAASAGKGIASAAYSGLKGSIDKISRLIDDNIDTQPVITPVLDLSEIQNGSNQLFSMMSGITDLGLSESYSLGNNIMARVSREKIAEEEQMLSVLKDIDSSMKNISDNSGSTMENTFNITGNDPEEIADEISRILARQVERRGASWA